METLVIERKQDLTAKQTENQANTLSEKLNENKTPKVNKTEAVNSGAGRLSLKSFSRTVPVAPADALCKDILELFEQHSSCECIVMEDEAGAIVGLAMRHRFSYKLAHRYSVALFYNRPALKLVDMDPIIVSCDTNPHQLIELAMSREGDSLYDCIVLTEQGKFFGVLTVGDLLKLVKALEQEAEKSSHAIVQSAGQQIRGIAEDVRKVEQSALAGDELSVQMVDLTLQGKVELSKVQESFHSLEKGAELQGERMKDLQREAGAIESVSHLIKELAEQCNLLSINASIEAARAGEYGKGFAVVAGEFARLANQTKQSAVQITAITKAIAQSIEAASAQVEEVRMLTNSSSKHVEKAGEVYHQIFNTTALNRTTVSEIGTQATAAHMQAMQVFEKMELLKEQLHYNS